MCIFCSKVEINQTNSQNWDLLFDDSLNNQEKRLILSNFIRKSNLKDIDNLDNVFEQLKMVFNNKACDKAIEKFPFLIEEAKSIANLDPFKLAILHKIENEIDHSIGVKTPKEIENELHEYVIGHDDTVKRYSLLGYQQLLRTKGSFKSEQKLNSILIGDTGSGKTHLVKSFAKVLGLPYKIIPATAITQEGWSGASISDYLSELYNENTNGEYGIVFFDEIDKITTSGKEKQLRNHLEAVQNELLTIIEGMEGKNNDNVSYKTHKMMFIFGGAFAKLFENNEEKKDNKLKTIGFVQTREEALKNELENQRILEKESLKKELENKRILEKEGLKKELLGRIASFNVLSKLSKEQLHNVLYAKDGFFEYYKNYFIEHKVELSFHENFENKIIDELHNDLRFGIREFNDILFKYLEPFMFISSGLDLSKEHKLEITNENIENPSVVFFKNNDIKKQLEKEKDVREFKKQVLYKNRNNKEFDVEKFMFLLNAQKDDPVTYEMLKNKYLSEPVEIDDDFNLEQLTFEDHICFDEEIFNI